MYYFGLRSESNLMGVHPDLKKLMEKAIADSPHDFAITEGLRTLERQQQLFEEKKTQTLNSRHLTGHAVDIAVKIEGKVTWEFSYYKSVADHVKKVAEEMNISIVWGGDWKSFKDGPHFELDKKIYG